MSEKTIGALSRFTGISAHTIKYYEKIGLLSVGRKENSNYRSYDMRVCTDIYECVKYRNMGFSLKDTQELVKEASNERVSELLAERKDRIHGREGYLHVPAGRAFVTYIKFAGPYVSDGRMGQELMKVYRQFRQDTPKEAFGQRIRITRDGTVWNYFKVFIPLAEE